MGDQIHIRAAGRDGANEARLFHLELIQKTGSQYTGLVTSYLRAESAEVEQYAGP